VRSRQQVVDWRTSHLIVFVQKVWHFIAFTEKVGPFELSHSKSVPVHALHSKSPSFIRSVQKVCPSDRFRSKNVAFLRFHWKTIPVSVVASEKSPISLHPFNKYAVSLCAFKRNLISFWMNSGNRTKRALPQDSSVGLELTRITGRSYQDEMWSGCICLAWWLIMSGWIWEVSDKMSLQGRQVVKFDVKEIKSWISSSNRSTFKTSQHQQDTENGDALMRR
jgi:hypothetical protein